MSRGRVLVGAANGNYKLENYISDLTDTLGEEFIGRMTYEDYPVVAAELDWSYSTYIRVLRHFGLDIGDLETRRSREIRKARLAEIFTTSEMDRLSYRDYPRVKTMLGWTESTFKTALAYLGKDGGNLRTPRRTYIPTDEEIEVLEQHVSRSLIRTLVVTGCRFGELWRMDIMQGELIIYTEKGGDKVHIVLTGMERTALEDIKHWVEYGCKTLSYDAARKRWYRAVERGLVSNKCQPHNFRHRAATLYDEAGVDTQTIAEMLGHRDVNTTRRYKHGKNGQRAAALLLPGTKRK